MHLEVCLMLNADTVKPKKKHLLLFGQSNDLILFGMQFELESDHKPLECIYSRKSKPSARIERWVLRLQGYNFKVVYRPGKTNIADVLSRLNLKVNRDYGEKYDYVAALVGSSTIPALRSDEIDVASKNDPEVVELRQCIQTGDWSNCS